MNDETFVTEFLIKNKITISFMESCTSGLLASMFTDTEGASSVFRGSLVTYCNQEKIRFGVDAEIIEKYGVYSEECAQAMAQAVQKFYGTEIAVGITGSTGNTDPANKDSIPGECFFCIRVKETAYSQHIVLDTRGMTRSQIKQHYAIAVYQQLRKIMNISLS